VINDLVALVAPAVPVFGAVFLVVSIVIVTSHPAWNADQRREDDGV
jgi:hypothetical protein